MSKNNQLVGRCPICSGPKPSSGDNNAYNPSTINDSDKDMYLVWSAYYQLFVCRSCKIIGEDKTLDERRDEDDKIKEESRQRMGFGKNYITN